METSILWSHMEYSVRDILQCYVPMIVQVAEGSGTSQQSPCPGEIYRFHAIASHQRAVCESQDGQLYSIPLQYPIKFSKPGEVHQTLSELCKDNELPFHVVMEKTNNQFKIGEETHTSIDLGQLTVRDVIQEKYIKANLIRPGYMSKSVVVFTPTTHCRLRIAEDLDYDQNTLGYSWDEFNRALDSIAKTIDFRKTYQNLDILQFTDSDLVSAAVKRNPRRRNRNSSETDQIYADFGARTYATLVRPISGAGDSSITKSVQRVIEEQSVYSKGSWRRSSDSSAPGSVRTYGSYMAGSGSKAGPPSVAVVRPSQPATGSGYTGAERRRMRPVSKTRSVSMADAVSVYEQIDPAKMDADITSFIRNNEGPAEDGGYLTPVAVDALRLITDPLSGFRLVDGGRRNTLWPPATPLEALTSPAGSAIPQTTGVRLPLLIKTTDDIPPEVEKLTTTELADCLILLNLGQYAAEFESEQIDGELLVLLTEENMIKDFKMKGTHAKKLCQFKTGWRPK